MDNQTITCPKCKTNIPLSEAITHQISDSIIKEEREKLMQEAEAAKQVALAEANKATSKKFEQELKNQKKKLK